MSKQFNNHNEFNAGESGQLRHSRRQVSGRQSSDGDFAPVSAGAAIRQQQAQGSRASAAGKGRLDYDSAVNNHGQRASQRTARDYDRSRYTGAHSATASSSRHQQGRRHVELDQSGQIPRYNPADDPRSREQIAAQRNRNVQNLSQGANRFARTNDAYQARPEKASNGAPARGLSATPLSMLIRIGLIVILVAFFGIRALASRGSVAQLNEVTAAVSAQQEELDKITAENESLQTSIDSRQSTIDAYNALVKSQS